MCVNLFLKFSWSFKVYRKGWDTTFQDGARIVNPPPPPLPRAGHPNSTSGVLSAFCFYAFSNLVSLSTPRRSLAKRLLALETPGLKLFHSPLFRAASSRCMCLFPCECPKSSDQMPLCLCSYSTLYKTLTIPWGRMCNFFRLWKPLLTQFLWNLSPEIAQCYFKDSTH